MSRTSGGSNQLARPMTGGGGKSRKMRSVSCNHPKCRKSISTTVFVCSCDCLFCEDCTYGHFTNNSSCPVCNRTLTESDFMEVNVTDPPPAQQANKNTAIRNLFTTLTPNAPTLTFQDMCTRSMKLTDECRDSYKFLMKQFLLDTNHMAQRLEHSRRMIIVLQEKIRSMKLSGESEKRRTEQAVADVQEKNGALQKKIADKERQLVQFRKLHGMMTPSSPHGVAGGDHNMAFGGSGSGSGGGVGGKRMEDLRRVSIESNSHERPPPLKGFMMQKQASDLARQRMLDQAQHRAPRLGQPASSVAPRQGAFHAQEGMPGQSGTARTSRFALGGSDLGLSSYPPETHDRKRRHSASPNYEYASTRRPHKARFTSPTHAFANASTGHHGRDYHQYGNSNQQQNGGMSASYYPQRR